ncbi:50S ribosomal protein L6 [Guyparkeria sp. SCN-R1]|uniref:50S ribosomal protein L6 n=1 Tax=unclassified Guyparkeria TaxID=2626246 RepID=UPI000F652D01|nr:50S ribosomal protein L6 [Guyparkeria sp. SCN-R1]RRQ23251.1 50S ribosomal protein L6 [Guyparkeria sp. SCN-R1]
MSRVARKPVAVPKGVEVKLEDQVLSFKGKNGELTLNVHPTVGVTFEDNEIRFAPNSDDNIPMAGTMRSLAQGSVDGVANGFEIKLQLVGVGYRAQVQGRTLNLQLGFSHPIDYPLPDGVTAETPSATEIIIRGADKQKVGQVASNVRALRPPEPYKGKGVKYADERILRKEAKKK